MSAPAMARSAPVSPEEVARRIAEYRRIGFQRGAPAHVVYHEEHHACPWAGCDIRIAGISFQLETFGDTSRQAELLAGWWNGPGLVARCPGCGRYVLFALDEKRAVIDPASCGTSVLPDDWHEKAHVVTRPV